MTNQTLNIEDISNDLHDIQGLITRGFGKFPDARYLLIEIEDATAAKSWLNGIADQITDSVRNELGDEAINIAFNYDGLLKLGMKPDTANQFSREFKEGMVTPHRQRLLGDHGSSGPETWRFGGPKNPGFHLMLLLFGSVAAGTLDPLLKKHRQEVEAAGMKIHHELDANTLPGRKEHFGFRDGISQPLIKGGGKKGDPRNTLNPGEFLFGYKNGYNEIPTSQTIPNQGGPEKVLPDEAIDPSDLVDGDTLQKDARRKDFGRNGSYLVYRQLSQDVPLFWKYMEDNSDSKEERIKLASKMVGRWPSGAPLAKYPDHDPKEDPANPHSASNDDSFGYRSSDEFGDKCPFGSHLRRNNPRDARDATGSAEESIELVNRHRIIRRGRPYGDPLVSSMDSDEVLTAGEAQNEMGLQFICFNTNIARQFEFIQHTWVNNPKFNRLYNDPDPVMGDPDPEGKGQTADFTTQMTPVRTQVTGIPRFVDVRGGAYFFMPGLRALKYLATV